MSFRQICVVNTVLAFIISPLSLAVAGPPAPVSYKPIPNIADDAVRHITVKTEDRGLRWEYR